MRKKKIEVLNVSRSGDEWTIIFALPNKLQQMLVVPVIEPDARAFISALDMREEPVMSRSIPGEQTGSMFH